MTRLPTHRFRRDVTPALDLWRLSMAAGVDGQRADSPGTWEMDALYRAACAEMWAVEFEQDRIPEVATWYRAKAKSILVDAFRREAAA